MFEPTEADYMANAIGMAWADGLTTDDLFQALLFVNEEGGGQEAQDFNVAIWALTRLKKITQGA